MKKYFFKKYHKYIQLHHYVALLRRQPVHMQHVYAGIFAGVITALLATVILYFDYGFWHERYHRTETTETLDTTPATSSETVQPTLSPAEMIGSFFHEAKEKVGAITIDPSAILQGSETYQKEVSGSTTEE